MVAGAATAVWIEIADCHTEFRAQFLTRRAYLRERMSENGTVLRRLALSAEAVLEAGARPSAQVEARFVAGRGFVLDDAPTRRRYAVSATVDADHPASDYFDLLAISERMLGKHVSQRYLVPQSNRIYLNGNEGRFAATLVGETSAGNSSQARYEQLSGLLRKQWPDVDALVRDVAAHPERAAQDVIWLPSRFDPVSSERVIGAALWVFDRRERPVMLIVETMNPVLFPADSDDGDSGSYTIVDRIGHGPVATTAVHVNDAMVALRAATNDRARNIEPRFVAGRFVVQDIIPDTDWRLVYVYSIRAIVKGLTPRLLVLMVVTLLGLMVLSGVVVLIDRRILGPAYRRAERLKEGEELNRTLIRTAPVGLALIAESDGTVRLRNDVMARYENPVYGEPLSRRIWRVFMAQVGDDPVASRRTLIDLDMPLMRVDDDACERNLLVNIVRVRYRGTDALLATIIDITARKQTEQSLVDARRAADQANKAKSVFLATMSHEIRTPLNAVLGNLELMKRGPLPDTQRRRLEIADSSSSALLRIVDDVLDLSRVEAGELHINSGRFDCAALMRDVTESFRPLATEKGLGLTCDIAPDMAPPRIGDPVRLRQIVSNLLGNAIKFTHTGTVRVTVRELQAHGLDAIEVAVADTGIGIPESAIPTIFAPYRQADDSIHRRYGGTGLGLALCQRLVDAMHGDISVRSKLREGSVFVVRVPLAVAVIEPAVDSADEPQVRPSEVLQTAVEREPLRVLAIEDHPASRLLLADQFREFGVDATIAENGAQALDMLAGNAFALVLTDLGLPDTDGWTLARAVLARDATMPIVGMTARIGERDALRCAEAGIRMLLRKPVSLGALQQALREHARGGGADTVSHANPERVTLTESMANTMREVTLASCASIDRALESGDAHGVMRELHSLSGGFASVGQQVLAELCSGLQQVVHDDGPGALVELWPALRLEMTSALDALQPSKRADAP
ncbi:ATP-binding protein [Burkholderia sp. AW33-5]